MMCTHHLKMQKDGWAKYIQKFSFKWSDVDDSGDILFPMLLCRWIQFSPIVNPLLHLISLYAYYFNMLYKLDVTSWSFGTALTFRPWVSRFYTCLHQGVYIAGHYDSDCLRYMVYLYHIEYIKYACYVNPPHPHNTNSKFGTINTTLKTFWDNLSS